MHQQLGLYQQLDQSTLTSHIGNLIEEAQMLCKNFQMCRVKHGRSKT